MFSKIAIDINNFFINASLILTWVIVVIGCLTALSSGSLGAVFIFLAAGIGATVVWAFVSGLWLIQVAQLETLKEIKNSLK